MSSVCQFYIGDLKSDGDSKLTQIMGSPYKSMVDSQSKRVKYPYDALHMMIGDRWIGQILKSSWVLLKCVKFMVLLKGVEACIDGGGKENTRICVPLYEASIRGG
ncbi:hypothetical protein L1987_61476 [Smallanthus sonchifolius]|uniref:Uncharacterized protein n=1 Tax=Smallanthus sonchifolius TaxID=185202 RepID=A0ACB9C7N0_9ASTR|nr:hypothetical protein L1987_61476 [Smallanthus sonchifolius]